LTVALQSGSGGGLLFHRFNISVDVDTIITADSGNGGGQGGTTSGGGLVTFLSNTAGSFSNDGLVRADPGSGVGVCDSLSTNVSLLTSSDISEDRTSRAAALRFRSRQAGSCSQRASLV
jgi:hypothetical protein